MSREKKSLRLCVCGSGGRAVDQMDVCREKKIAEAVCAVVVDERLIRWTYVARKQIAEAVCVR
jgi:hypothetical protein